jgi:hypothetical protein
LQFNDDIGGVANGGNIGDSQIIIKNKDIEGKDSNKSGVNSSNYMDEDDHVPQEDYNLD